MAKGGCDNDMKKKLLFATNVDWYFDLHWKERVFSEMTSDFDVTVCYSITAKKFNKEIIHSNKVLPLRINRSSINPFLNFFTFLQAKNILRNNSFDCIHTATVKPNIYFGLLAKMYSLPIFITVPGLGTVFSSQGVKCAVIRFVIRFLYRFIGKNKKTFFIFENKDDRAYFLERDICKADYSSVVSGAGVDLETFKSSEEPSCRNKPIKILFAARLLRGKGLDDLISAANIVNSENEQINICIAGIHDPDSRESIPLSAIHEWQNFKYVHFFGQVENMPKLLSEMHIIVLPSNYGEGLPRILIEANACGRPVITTHIAGCRDFVIDGLNGLLITPGSVDELVIAINRLMDKDLRKKMGEEGRRRVELNYAKEIIIDQYKSIYKNHLLKIIKV